MITFYKKYFMSASQIKIFINSFIALLMISWMFFGCKPDNTISDLQAKPKADFTIVNGADDNTVILVNTTSSPSVAHWFQYSTGQRVDSKDSATMHFTFAGTYSATLIAAGNGGLD